MWFLLRCRRGTSGCSGSSSNSSSNDSNGLVGGGGALGRSGLFHTVIGFVCSLFDVQIETTTGFTDHWYVFVGTAVSFWSSVKIQNATGGWFAYFVAVQQFPVFRFFNPLVKPTAVLYVVVMFASFLGTLANHVFCRLAGVLGWFVVVLVLFVVVFKKDSIVFKRFVVYHVVVKDFGRRWIVQL